MLLPSFYCEDTVNYFRRFAEVRFYNMDWCNLDADNSSFTDLVRTLKPKVVVIYNVFGKESVLLTDTSWLRILPNDSIIISDCAHSLLPLHDLTPLTQNHFFIDSPRKCTPFMFSHCVYPDENYKRSYKAKKVSWYSVITRILFGTKQWLAALHLKLRVRVLADWSEKIFMIHNGIIGLSNISHAAWFFDPIGFAHIDFDEIVNARIKLWHAYKEEFLRFPLSRVRTYQLSPQQIGQMSFFPIRVPRDSAQELICSCVKLDVQAERLWNLDRISGLSESECQSGMEIVVLPFTPNMSVKDARQIASTVAILSAGKHISPQGRPVFVF